MPYSLTLVYLTLLLLVHQLVAVGFSPLTQDEDPSEPLPAGLVIETVADQLVWPVAMAFAPDGRLFFTEKGPGTGRGNGEQPASISVITRDRGQIETFATLQVSTDSDRGLLGIALDPDFEHNRYVYALYTQMNPLTNRVIRFRDENNVGVEPKVILEIPYVIHEDRPNDMHNGGNINFGPGDKLYVTIGDNNFPSNSQDLDVLPGKILRLYPDGSAPRDNPFYTSAGAFRSKIYAYGLRNSFDFTFDPLSGAMFATENGPVCNDELNWILPGGNYGWPLTAPCLAHPAGTLPPLLTYQQPIAPTGITFYDSGLISEWQYDLFFCDLNTGALRRAALNTARNAITSVAKIDISQRCDIDVAVGPDGALYFISWNGSGPGSIHRISRLSQFRQFLPLIRFQN